MLIEITLLDKNSVKILQGSIMTLPLDETCIINKSIELFNDDEPCIIHKSYVIKAILFEMNDYLENCLKKGYTKLKWDCLPKSFCSYINIKEKIDLLEIKYSII